MKSSSVQKESTVSQVNTTNPTYTPDINRDLYKSEYTPEIPVNEPINNLIIRDHIVAKTIYEKFCACINKEDALKWRNQLVYEITVHSLAEEIVLYPVLKSELPNGEMIYNTSIQEHRQLKEDLYKAQNLDANDIEFRNRVKQVMDDLLKHIEKEEKEVLPLLDKHVSLNKRVELGNQFERRKLIVPTKSHPSAPDQPSLVNSIISILTSPIDKFRDLFSSFPEQQKVMDIKKDAQSKATVSTSSDKTMSSTQM
jgi:hemerythrin-like domain-containing protein